MDLRKPYEQTIAGKLEALPIPDMADAIWARIEAGLDSDAPEGDDGPGDPAAPTGGGWAAPAALLVVATAIITVFYFNKNNNTGINNLPVSPTVNNDSPLSSPAIRDATGAGDNSPQQRGQPPPATTIRLPDSLTAADSTAIYPAQSIPPAQVQKAPDSATGTFALPPTSKPPDTVKKKGRGVPGITDDDYRIVPSRPDSNRRSGN